MKMRSIFAIAVVTAIGCFATKQASAITLRYSGDFTVDQAVGTAAPLLGTAGSFFYDIDFDNPDPDPSGVAGIIPNAVVARSITLGGQTYTDTSVNDLEINFGSGNGFNILAKTSPGFPDIFFAIFTDYDPEALIANPLTDGNFGFAEGLFLFGEGSLVSIVATFGTFDTLEGLMALEGALTSIDVVTEQTDPDTGNGGNPVTSVPVPAALPLLLSGLCGFLILRRRRNA
ncbi:PEP-CTERM sorting domain-containing protein [Hwanghaeella grinnelliae]|uniref:PEP-CTERM sorting domain-containing protein n=1 Tax=Hwanghaeella grinnelliae TaxID=2500179 RepID=A0A437QN20_9PROT|nr:VPLPA-CTERM sorting domain-containing protein [Hwanghaeella grinnelliae]RVU35941.1 PEP-CTERM sorting domain-containing protein [Hwanghaeella grinnelliae]